MAVQRGAYALQRRDNMAAQAAAAHDRAERAERQISFAIDDFAAHVDQYRQARDQLETAPHDDRALPRKVAAPLLLFVCARDCSADVRLRRGRAHPLFAGLVI
jgi:hypothetical protein